MYGRPSRLIREPTCEIVCPLQGFEFAGAPEDADASYYRLRIESHKSL